LQLFKHNCNRLIYLVTNFLPSPSQNLKFFLTFILQDFLQDAFILILFIQSMSQLKGQNIL